MSRKEAIHEWLMAGLAAVEPARLVRDALTDHTDPMTVLAIGKAAAAMCRGAADAVDRIEGLCIASYEAPVPDQIELMVGDHPYPSKASLEAGRRAMVVAPMADLALISGGGSSLCEVPIEGLTIEFISDVNRALLDSGSNIAEINLVRSHLSRIKGGGLGPIPSLVLSDVAGAGAEYVSSGPTIAIPPAPDQVIAILQRSGIHVGPQLERAIRDGRPHPSGETTFEIVGDGRTAARAVVGAVHAGIPARLRDGWLVGDYLSELTEFITSSESGITVAAGEPSVPVESGGVGGRNTHTALRAARMISGTDMSFAALATDGIDGSSQSAGAIVDGTTVERGGDPSPALESYDSATYLGRTGDLIETGPTGTNVADLWLLWR